MVGQTHGEWKVRRYSTKSTSQGGWAESVMYVANNPIIQSPMPKKGDKNRDIHVEQGYADKLERRQNDPPEWS